MTQENDQPMVPSPKQVVATTDGPLIRHGWLRALLFVIIFILTEVLFAVVVLIVGGATGIASLENLTGMGSMVKLLSIVISVGVTFLLWKFIDRRPIRELGFAFDRQKRFDLLSGLGVGVLLQTVVFLTLYMMGQVEIISVSFPAASFFTYLLLFIFVAIHEETLFRGYLLVNLMASMNRWVALLLISSLFAFAHAGNDNASAFGITNIVLAGILLGVYYVHRKNLWFPIGLHLTWNFFQGVIYGSPVSGLDTESVLQVEFGPNEMLTGGEFGFEASAITTVVSVLIIVAVHFMYRQSTEPKVTAIDRIS